MKRRRPNMDHPLFLDNLSTDELKELYLNTSNPALLFRLNEELIRRQVQVVPLILSSPNLSTYEIQ